MAEHHRIALKASAISWMVWGAVHMLAGVIVLSADASGGFQAIADAVDPDLIETDYHPAVAGVLNQHGWNLGWGGLATIIGAAFIWRENATAIWVTAMVGGLLDIGYLVFVDIPGFARFMPGTLMTFLSASAIALSFWAWWGMRSEAREHT